ncbi:MAG: four helix bundle protein [Nonlabens sp.]|uniref:four helix bundle protein n=1 Tax=Nonlabens sp. TaxID=1888209 RepID=UPI003EF1F186
MGKIERFEDLEIWQLAREITNDIQNISRNSELRKDFKLYSQIDGSSGSAMDNIAEGFERGGNKEFHQFLSISKASIGETRSQMYRVVDRNYCDRATFEMILNKCLTLSRRTKSFMKYLKESDLKGNKFK